MPWYRNRAPRESLSLSTKNKKAARPLALGRNFARRRKPRGGGRGRKKKQSEEKEEGGDCKVPVAWRVEKTVPTERTWPIMRARERAFLRGIREARRGWPPPQRWREPRSWKTEFTFSFSWAEVGEVQWLSGWKCSSFEISKYIYMYIYVIFQLVWGIIGELMLI